MSSLSNPLENNKPTEKNKAEPVPQPLSDKEEEPQAKPTPSYLPQVRESEFLPETNPWLTLGGLFIVATLGISLILAGLIKYNVTVKTQATVRPKGELSLVQASSEGTVKLIKLQENQLVKKGDVIATLDDSRLQTQKSQLQSQLRQANLQLMQMDAQIQAINAQIFAEIERAKRTVLSAKAELNGRQRDYQDRKVTTSAEVREAQANLESSQDDWQRGKAELKATEANLQSAKSSLKVARKRYHRYQQITKEGVLSQEQLEEAEIAVEQQEQAVEQQKASVEAQKQNIERLEKLRQVALARLQGSLAALNPSSSNVVIASEQVEREKALGDVTSAVLRREKESLLQQRIAVVQQQERDNRQLQQVEIDLQKTKILATAEGIMFRLNLRNAGQNLRPGEEIAQIVPSNASLIIEAAVSPSDIGKLKIGQTVQMQVSACPYPDYGTLKGKVQTISQDTIKSADSNSNNHSITTNQKTAFYKVIIAPETLTFGSNNNQCTLKLGMEGRADIISREETILQFFLRKARLLTDV